MKWNTLHRRALPLALALAPLAVATACGDDPAGPDAPTMAVVAGDYSAGGTFGALSFTTTSGGATIDWLDEGADLTLELSAGGTVTGRLYIPVPEGDWDAYFEEEDLARGFFEADMAGGWTLTSSTVRFEQDADSFVRDLDFVWSDGTLTGERTFGDVTVRVVLVKQ